MTSPKASQSLGVPVWWRVDLDEDGRVTSCERTGGGFDSGYNGIFYILAVSAAAAVKAAKSQSLELQRERQALRNARLADKGLCRCGRLLGDGERRCEWCLERDKLYKKREIKKRHGEAVPRLNRHETRAERRAQEQQVAVAAAPDSVSALRRTVLSEVHTKWIASRTNAEFSQWLKRELEKSGVQA